MIETIENLGRQAVITAEAGVDIVAPSAMMDGQVAAIRVALDQAGHHRIADHGVLVEIRFRLSMDPFRAAAGTSLKGDRKAYQMDPF